MKKVTETELQQGDRFSVNYESSATFEVVKRNDKTADIKRIPSGQIDKDQPLNADRNVIIH